MSYSITDRYGGIVSSYHPAPGVTACGQKTWWPDFGPGVRDFSAQERSHPTDSIFRTQVECRRRPAAQTLASQFRHPAPAREALLITAQPSVETKLAAHEFTEKQSALRRLEVQQKRIDKWIQEPPIRRIQSEPGSLMDASRNTSASSSALEANRSVYEKHGYLVGRHTGSVADGLGGLSGKRRANSMSFSAMLFKGELVEEVRKPRRKKPSKQWHVTPASRYVFDPTTFLPVPRGGWDAQVPTEWPALRTTGSRGLRAPEALALGDAAAPMPIP